MRTAIAIHQHHDGTHDVRLLGDLATTVRSVHAQLSNVALDADAHARVSVGVRTIRWTVRTPGTTGPQPPARPH